MSEPISREEAIYILKANYPDPCFEQLTEAVDMAISALKQQQPEPMTDKEQRIFLAAMSREEKVCKQVDDECRYCREPYEDSLVRTCHEIKRKVKGVLWGKKDE